MSNQVFRNQDNRYTLRNQKIDQLYLDQIYVDTSNDFLIIDNNNLVKTKNKVFGNNYRYANSQGVSSTNSATFQNKVSLTSNFEAGDYLVGYSCQLANQSAGGRSEIQLTEDTIQIQTAELPTINQNNDYIASSQIEQRTLTNASHTFELNFRAVTNTARIRQARIFIFRVN